jgi:hypothetical protein
VITGPGDEVPVPTVGWSAIHPTVGRDRPVAVAAATGNEREGRFI